MHISTHVHLRAFCHSSKWMLGAAIAAVAILSCPATSSAQDDDPVFSGPQVGEKLAGFEAELFNAGDRVPSFDPIATADGKPVVIIFMHNFTRPAFGLMRSTIEYTKTLQEKGLSGAAVFLSDDATAMKERLTRASNALPKDFRIGVYMEGLEGPGSYGLNRNVTMTVLVAKDDQVTANFALVQPSLQADGFKIVSAIAETVGVEAPAQEAFEQQAMRANRGTSDVPDRTQVLYRTLMSPVIQKDADEATVDAAAAKLEEAAAKNADLRQMVGTASRRIVSSGRLETYGNEFAQAYIKKWSEEFK